MNHTPPPPRTGQDRFTSGESMAMLTHLDLAHLPPAPGTYALVLRVSAPTTLAVGQLGDITFSPGYYVYIGSAHGPGGVKARVAAACAHR